MSVCFVRTQSGCEVCVVGRCHRLASLLFLRRDHQNMAERHRWWLVACCSHYLAAGHNMGFANYTRLPLSYISWPKGLTQSIYMIFQPCNPSSTTPINTNVLIFPKYKASIISTSGLYMHSTSLHNPHFFTL